jgi:hypothetical protein
MGSLFKRADLLANGIGNNVANTVDFKENAQDILQHYLHSQGQDHLPCSGVLLSENGIDLYI